MLGTPINPSEPGKELWADLGSNRISTVTASLNLSLHLKHGDNAPVLGLGVRF